MNEQAPYGDLGGNVVVKTWHGMTRAEVEAWAEERPGDPLHIGRIESDNGNYEEDLKTVVDSIDGLLALFDIDQQNWQGKVLKLHRDNAFPRKEEYRESVQRNAEGKSAGRALAEWAEYNLRIEDEEDGTGTVHLVLALSESLKVSLRAAGDHWSGHHYRDPDTGDIISDKWDDNRIMELRKELGDDGLELVEYEVGFLFDCEARFSQPGGNDVWL